MNTGKSVRHAERLQAEDFENECVRGSVIKPISGTEELTLTATAIVIVKKNLRQ
jgi:hypothetical protein